MSVLKTGRFLNLENTHEQDVFSAGHIVVVSVNPRSLNIIWHAAEPWVEKIWAISSLEVYFNW